MTEDETMLPTYLVNAVMEIGTRKGGIPGPGSVEMAACGLGLEGGDKFAGREQGTVKGSGLLWRGHWEWLQINPKVRSWRVDQIGKALVGRAGCLDGSLPDRVSPLLRPESL